MGKQYAGPNPGKVISCSLTIDRAVLQGPHRAGKRGGGASVVPPTAGFGRWAKAEATSSASQRMDAQNAGSGVHARPGRLLTPKARGGASGSPQNRRLQSIRSRCRSLKCFAKMGVLTVISVLLGEQAQRAFPRQLCTAETLPPVAHFFGRCFRRTGASDKVSDDPAALNAAGRFLPSGLWHSLCSLRARPPRSSPLNVGL